MCFRSYFSFSLTAVALLCCSAERAAIAQRSSTVPCISWDSSTPLITASGEPVFLDNPVVGAQGDTLYVIGRGPVDLGNDHRPYVKIPFSGIQITPKGPAREIGAPRFAGDFFAPQISIADGKLTALWGEGSENIDPAPAHMLHPINLPTVRSLWSAVWDSKGWSAPRLIAAQPMLLWRPGAPSTFTTGTPNRFIAVGAETRTGQGVLVLQLSDTTWRVADIPTGTPPLLVSLAEQHNRILLLYVAADTAFNGDRNTIFAVRSSDKGQSWSRPVRVWHSPTDVVMNLSIDVSQNGILHLAWSTHTGNETFGAQYLNYSSSKDLGTTWSTPERWNANMTFMNLTVASDRGGDLVAIYQAADSNEKPHLFFTSRSPKATWSSPVQLFGEVPARNPVLLHLKNGDVVLLYSSFLEIKNQIPLFRLSISHLRYETTCKDRQGR